MYKDIPVESFRRYLHCDECGKLMTPTGAMLTSNPPQFPHVCENGHQVSPSLVYPIIVHREREFDV